MKLLMTCTEDLALKVGVKKKIFGQMKAFSIYCSKVWLLYNRGGDIVLVDAAHKQEQLLAQTTNIFQFRIVFFTQAYAVAKTLCPDAIYQRTVFAEPNYLRFLKKVKALQVPIFSEYPTYPYDEEYKRKSFFKRLLFQVDKIYRRQLHHYIQHAFTYTDYQDIFGIPASRIENGIDVAQIPLRQLAMPKSENCTLLGVANLSIWHGYDRIIQGLRNHYSEHHPTRVDFLIIGEGAELPNLKILVNTYKLQKYVHFIGKKYGNELYQLYNETNIGIGSLAMHRIGLTQGAPLKVREYCAIGIPFVIGYTDHDFPETFPYCFHLEADESPVDIIQLLTFYERIVPEEAIPNMREYALNHLDWTVKLQPVIEKIKTFSLRR
jgi:hypothetical protein